MLEQPNQTQSPRREHRGPKEREVRRTAFIQTNPGKLIYNSKEAEDMGYEKTQRMEAIPNKLKPETGITDKQELAGGALEQEQEYIQKKLGHATSIERILNQLALRGDTAPETEAALQEQAVANVLAQGNEVPHPFGITPEEIGAGVTNTNPIFIRELVVKGQHVSAYCKPRRLTSIQYTDDNRKHVYTGRYEWSPATDRYEPVQRIVTDPEVTKGYLEKVKERFYPGAVAAIAECYGIPEKIAEDYFSRYEWSSRVGVPPYTEIYREFGASVLARLLRLHNVIPVTTLRKEPGGLDLSSAQEGIKGAIPNFKPYTIDSRPNDTTFRDIVEQGPNHPGAESFMQLATFHYLIGMLDGEGNIMWDGKSFHGIDHSMSMGLSNVEQETLPNGTTKSVIKGIDRLVSVPLEAVWMAKQKYPNWKLDQKTLDNFRKVYDAIISYLQKRAELTDANGTLTNEARIKLKQMQNISDREVRILQETFILIFENAKIAKVEGERFLKKLKQVIDLGAPPKLDLRDYEPKLQKYLPATDGAEKVAA